MWVGRNARGKGRFILTAGVCMALSLCLILPGVSSAAGPDQAQASDLRVTITRPSEGETVYSSPTSLVYVLPVTGRVTGTVFDPSQIEVQLEVLQRGSLVGSAVSSPSTDGSFVFEVTVNSSATHEGELNREEQCGGCHRTARLGLGGGSSAFRVTAIDPDGGRASAERHFTVDVSGMAALPLRVVAADDPAHGIAGIPVVGSAWLYEWRARSARAVTGPDGQAVLRVEALAQSHTVYLLEVPPSVIDGALYQTAGPVEVTLPPGADSSQLITLQVDASRGQIAGRLSGGWASLDRSWPVYAVEPSAGARFGTFAGRDGTFAFLDIPLAEYIVAPDMEMAAKAGYLGLIGRVDLLSAPTISISLPLSPRGAGQIRGSVADRSGAPLPFAWLTADGATGAEGVAPSTGVCLLDELGPGWQVVVASAPGFFSRAQVVKPQVGSALAVEFQLEMQPQTRVLPWGKGQVIIPPESQVNVNESALSVALTRGWVWGEGGDGRPLTVATSDATIELQQGSFALEHAAGRSPWLYVLEGQAVVTGKAYGEPVLVVAGEMLALADSAYPVAIPAELTVVSVLRRLRQSPVDPVWQPNLLAQIRDRLARLGVNASRAAGWGILVGALTLIAMVLGRVRRRFGRGA